MSFLTSLFVKILGKIFFTYYFFSTEFGAFLFEVNILLSLERFFFSVEEDDYTVFYLEFKAPFFSAESIFFSTDPVLLLKALYAADFILILELLILHSLLSSSVSVFYFYNYYYYCCLLILVFLSLLIFIILHFFYSFFYESSIF